MTKQGVRDLNNVGGAPHAWPRRGREVAMLDRCLASETHRMVHVRDHYDRGGLGDLIETWQCRTCGTTESRRIDNERSWW
jgi:hypothetical protein